MTDSSSVAGGVVISRASERLFKLDVGAGKTSSDDYATIDRSSNADFQFDLELCGVEKLPFDDNTFVAVKCSHVLEHITNLLPLMQELHRVTVAGGQLIIRVPYGASDNADEDPTHVRRFFPDSCGYFSQAAYGGADYNYRGDWKIVNRLLRLRPDPMVDEFARQNDMEGLKRLVFSFRNLVDEMIFLLECVKPIRIPGTFKEAAPIQFVLPEQPKSENLSAGLATPSENNPTH